MNQWTITALGMGTVFIALIGLSFIVSLFPLVFRGKEKVRPHPAPLPSLSSVAPGPAQGLSPETVAVIAAAISAASGLSPSQFRIAYAAPTSQAGGFNTPAWGHVDRFNRPTSIR